LRQLIENPATTEFMRLPHIEQPPSGREDKTVRNIYESIGWWNHVVMGVSGVEKKQTEFGKENNRRNIVLGLNVDGVSPFQSSTKSYTPMQCLIYNLPENLRHRAPFPIIAALIPGPKAPKTVKPYLALLLAEIRRLEEDGFEVMDPTIKQKVTVRVKLLCTCCDLPAHSDNNEQQGASAKWGCMKCEVEVSRWRCADATQCASA
jgi:hypothetical protein